MTSRRGSTRCRRSRARAATTSRSVSSGARSRRRALGRARSDGSPRAWRGWSYFTSRSPHDHSRPAGADLGALLVLIAAANHLEAVGSGRRRRRGGRALLSSKAPQSPVALRRAVRRAAAQARFAPASPDAHPRARNWLLGACQAGGPIGGAAGTRTPSSSMARSRSVSVALRSSHSRTARDVAMTVSRYSHSGHRRSTMTPRPRTSGQTNVG